MTLSRTGDGVCKVVYQVCLEPHVETRLVDLKFALLQQVEMAFTGPKEVLRQGYKQDQALDRYKSDLEVILGTCLSCRIHGHRFNHTPQKCSRRFH